MMEIHPERSVDLTDLHRDDREKLRPWVGVGLLLALVMLLSILGCTVAEVPLCEKYQAEMGIDQDGRPVVILDMTNVKKLGQLVTGLAAGTCRIEAPKSEGKPA
jgi:hypothetical protein